MWKGPSKIDYFGLQVPLGVLLHDENKLDEMGKIMTHYMTLVPTTSAEGHFTLPSGDLMNFDDTRFHQVLFGGDQLTVACMRGTQALCDTQDKPTDRLEGLTPVVEDWHTRMTLMKVRHTRKKYVKSSTYLYPPLPPLPLNESMLYSIKLA